MKETIDKIILFEVEKINTTYKNKNLDEMYHPLQNLKGTMHDLKIHEEKKFMKIKIYLEENLPKQIMKEINEYIL
ncbi:hypothetical protein K9L67_04875 [Candidatus Woesearchaeota archaeon]|nr:hypothetical protein [Candidatus Woesearchaeota archaeon]MCF7901533.1 hypothetical protein [Candidatus Woesearchaeota archaeon]MCF8013877.1 hypothetical protein [Candidatus Woesearchaeota archaeon]